MTARRLRVLEMIDKPTLGGGQVHVLGLAGALSPERFEVSVASGTGGPFEAEAIRAGRPFIPVAMGKSLDLKAARSIASVLKDRRFDIVHTHGGVAGLTGRWAARIAGTPVVVHTLHGIHYLHYRNPLLRLAFILQERYWARRTDAVIVVSGADAAAARKHRLAPEGKIRLILNGVSPSAAEGPSRAREERTAELRAILPSDGPLVASVARLHRQKGLIHMIDAAPSILRRVPGAKFAVIGGGPLEADLRRRIGKLGLGNRFFLLGERPDAAELIGLAGVFVLPSLWEGLPLVLLEAAAAGKPIVATEIDGTREVVRDGETALLVPPADPVRLADAVVRLLEDRGLAAELGERARAEIPGRFTLAGMVEAVERLYLELAARKGVI